MNVASPAYYPTGAPGLVRDPIRWVCYYFQAGRLVYTAIFASQKEESLSTGKIIYVVATLVSILISITLYRGEKRELGIFVGLWAPTILNLGQTLVDEEQR